MTDYLCPVCKRSPRGFAYVNPLLPLYDSRSKASERRFCSRQCLNVWVLAQHDGGFKVVDLTNNEIKAMEAASDAAGEYIESIGKTDMATFSPDEWMTMVEAIVTGFSDRLGALNAEDAPPF